MSRRTSGELESYTSRCMVMYVSRTTIEIDDEVMRRVQAGYGLLRAGTAPRR